MHVRTFLMLPTSISVKKKRGMGSYKGVKEKVKTIERKL
jgi:hypothetical protein